LGLFVKVVFFAEALRQVHCCVSFVHNNSLGLVASKVHVYKQ
jgi:hypothetical protein